MSEAHRNGMVDPWRWTLFWLGALVLFMLATATYAFGVMV